MHKPLKKPEAVANSPFMSAKWDEITKDRNFEEGHAQLLQVLCYWHAVINQCMSDITYDGGIQVCFENKLGDLKAFPQIETMKKASHEIRQLNKQLGIRDEEEEVEEPKPPTEREKVLKLVIGNRQSRAKSAHSS